jgi:deoxyribonuclease-4
LGAIEHIKKLGLDCLEVEFVKGVKMGSDMAKLIRQKADSLDIRLSLHAPYYINLNSPEGGKRLASQERLIASARLARQMGARNVVFHAGYYGQDLPEKAYDRIKKALLDIRSIFKSEGNPAVLRMETMGKKSQFGTLDEVLSLCREVEGLLPCLDFSHLHAREGGLSTYAHFSRILRKVEKKLGRTVLTDLHIHVSGVHYGDKGEIRHLDFMKSDFRYDQWVQAVRDKGVEGMVICESPNLETDALMLKNLYNSYSLKS